MLILAFFFTKLQTILELKGYPDGTIHTNANSMFTDYILREKQDGFYALPKDSLDVIFIGSSAVHCNINPGVIWNEYGIAGYDYACDQQEIGTSYYYLCQALENQSPKVVLIDINGDGTNAPLDSTAAHYALDHIKFDKYKLQAIFARAWDRWEEMFFPIILYHERWKGLKESDFTYKAKEDVFKGAFVYTLEADNEPFEIPELIPASELPLVTRQWLDKIVARCEEAGCEVIFMRNPMATYEEGSYSYYEAVGRYCDEKGLKFLNFTRMADELGLDYSSDFVDTLHMNWSGQQKMANWMGTYLMENYAFEDKRSDPAYSFWNEDYQKMLEYVDACKNTEDSFGQ